MKKYMILWVLTSLVWIVLSSSAFARVAKQEGTSCFITQPNTLSVDGVMISEYTCSQTTVKIPSQINWETVVQIGENAFRNKGITSLTLPNTLKAIEALAFADNALTRLEIQEWVETIGLGAFKRNQISVLKMPQSLKEIDADAFKANKLTKITVLWRLNKVWDGAFCDNITEKVEGVSESLEWEFSNACFSLKRASLLENSYPNDEIEIEETGEEIIMINSNEITDEEVDDELNEEVILEELDKDITETLDEVEEFINAEVDVNDWDEEVINVNDLEELESNFTSSISLDWMEWIKSFFSAVSLIFSIVIFLVWLLYSLFAIANYEVFKKAGKKWREFLVPVYGTMVQSEIAWLNKLIWIIPWLVTILAYCNSFIPEDIYTIIGMGGWLLSFLWYIIINYRIARRFNWWVWASICYVIFWPIAVIILGLWKSQYIMYQTPANKTDEEKKSIEPVVATEQLNNVVEHFVGADEENPSTWEDAPSTPIDISSFEQAEETINAEQETLQPVQEVQEVINETVENKEVESIQEQTPEEVIPEVQEPYIEEQSTNIEEPQVSETPSETEIQEKERPELEQPLTDLDQLTEYNK